MKNLYIHGHFNSDNYGDFLLYYVLINIVKKYKNKYNWYSSDIDLSYDNYCDVNRVNVKYAMKNSDLAIFAGGGYFAESDNKKLIFNLKCLIRHIFPAYILYKRKIPYIIVGVEVGPISFFLNRILLRKIFNNAEKISVRNEESKKFLQSIKVNNSINVNPDWIIGIDEDKIPIDDINVSNILQNNKKNFFIHLTSKIDINGAQNVINDLIEYQKQHKNIRYIFGCDQDKSSQKEKVKMIFNKFNNKENQLLYYKGPWYLSKILKNIDAVITDKLHVGIVATKFKKEVICVAKDPKSIRFYNIIGRKDFVCLLKNVKKHEILNKLEKIQFKEIYIDSNIFEKTKNNKKIVDDFLKKNYL